MNEADQKERPAPRADNRIYKRGHARRAIAYRRRKGLVFK